MFPPNFNIPPWWHDPSQHPSLNPANEQLLAQMAGLPQPPQMTAQGPMSVGGAQPSLSPMQPQSGGSRDAAYIRTQQGLDSLLGGSVLGQMGMGGGLLPWLLHKGWRHM